MCILPFTKLTKKPKACFSIEKEKFLLFLTKISYEKLTNLRNGFSSAFHTVLQNFRQKKVEIFLSMEKLVFSSALSKSFLRHFRLRGDSDCL
jgi:hypothetical protein